MQPIRNVAIIAHVDHGKTTLVDKILHHCLASGIHQDNQTLILDNNDLEKERGITIVSKNVSVEHKGTKINLIDTPGHADFGGEVERVLNMADGVLLLVDAFEGPMPQTRYVLNKAIQIGKKPIAVINKVDKENCRPEEVHEMIFDLMFNLEASEEQLDFPTAYGSAKHGWMSEDYQKPTDSIAPLLDMIIKHLPAPKVQEGNFQFQVTAIDYASYVGRIAIGRILRGVIKPGMQVMLIKKDTSIPSRIQDILSFEGLGRKKVEEAMAGEIVALTGVEGFDIGDTIADIEDPDPLPFIPIDDPTMSLLFSVNNSPFFGREGKFVTSRHLRDRLLKETEKNLALRVEETASPDSFLVYGRGIMHLSVLIETMRREGYELQVGQPQVIIKTIDGEKQEPIEQLTIDCPESCSGKIIEAVNQRKGEMNIMEPKGDMMHLAFSIPSRGIMGLRTQVLNLSAGEAIMAHRFQEYANWKGEIPTRTSGALIAHETGTVIPYALNGLQDRGHFFVRPGDAVYEGMVIGEHTRDNDLVVNVIKTKKLTNMRASGSDDKVKIPPPVVLSLEESLEYIQGDEYVEITPKHIRIRKIYLTENERKRMSSYA